MPNEKNWLHDIEEIDKVIELANNMSESDDMSWLTAKSEESMNFLEGIENIEVGSSPRLKFYASRGILEIVQKQLNGEQLYQYEMSLLWDFKREFPAISFGELEAAANELRK